VGEQKKKDTVCPFSFVKERKQGVLLCKLFKKQIVCRSGQQYIRDDWHTGVSNFDL
jgi:hypothetical protein